MYISLTSSPLHSRSLSFRFLLKMFENDDGFLNFLINLGTVTEYIKSAKNPAMTEKS